LPSTWGGAQRLDRAVANIQADSPDARIVDLADPSKKTLQGNARRRVSFSYDLVKDWDGPLREAVRHRPHLEPTYVAINTNNALIHPELDLSTPVECTFDWKLPPGWMIATSFGAGAPRQSFRGPWSKVQQAMFVAGDFRMGNSKLGKGVLVTATRGNFGVPDTEIRSRIIETVRLERDFWKDDQFPYYLVAVLPFDQGQGNTGGDGFTNAFSLHLSPQGGLSQGVLSLLAHEVFHEWNPYRIGQMREPAEGIYWFTEGFTTYYQDLLLWRAKQISFAQYLESLNQMLRDYFLSPERNLSLNELIERAQKEQLKGRVSYWRGAVIALWLDMKIRERTKAHASLDTLMSDLYQQAQHRTGPLPDLTADRVFQAAARYLPSQDVDQLRSYVERGSTVEAPSTVWGPCVHRESVEVPSFELGMERAALLERHMVTGLQANSEAQRAGLREGDSVVGMSIYWDDVSKPVGLTVRRGDDTSTITYSPRGHSVGVTPQYVLDQSRYHADPHGCQASSSFH
jgi:predicted metalloprotease with PDZ domain